MHPWSPVAVVAAGLVGLAVLAACAALAMPVQAASSGLVVKVSPSQGLVDRQTVTITGRGVATTGGGSTRTWFVAECTGAVRGRMNPATDTPHCDLTEAQPLHVTRDGTFSARYRVRTGIVGDGYCGTAGHATCVLGIGTAQGLGTVVRITFKAAPPAAATATTTTVG
jgi:hypothetical protein